MSDFVVEQEVPVQDRDPAVHSVQSSADIPSKKVGSRSRSQAAVVLGAILCAAVGFGIFWSLGIGSSSQGPFEKQFNPVAAWVSEQQPGLLEPHGAAASRVAEETPSTVNQHRNVSFESVVNPDGALPSRYSSESEFSSNASSTQFQIVGYRKKNRKFAIHSKPKVKKEFHRHPNDSATHPHDNS